MTVLRRDAPARRGFHVSRRGVLAGAAAGGGLVVAYLLLPQRFDAPLKPGEGEAGFNAWIKIATDGVITVAVPQCEMGQGVTTLIPQLAAMELGADWRQIAVEPAPPAGAYPNLALASPTRCWPAVSQSARALPPPPQAPRLPRTKSPCAKLRRPHGRC